MHHIYVTSYEKNMETEKELNIRQTIIIAYQHLVRQKGMYVVVSHGRMEAM